MKKFLITFLMILFTSIAVFADVNTVLLPSQVGKILSVDYVDVECGDPVQTKQIVEIEVLSGELKGEKILVDNYFTGNPAYDISLKKGLKVILHVEKSDDGLAFSIADVKRSGILLWLSAIFCGLLVYVGRKKGLYSLVSIILTCGLIFYLMSPMILLGVNPVIAALLLCMLSTIITMYLVGGVNRKSSSAILGTILSVLFATCLSFVAVKCASLNGIFGENSMFLYSAHPELNFVSILISAMILATLGAVMDVAMSIASTINEIYTIDNTKSVKELFTSGMNVGKDIIGTMANTLILVYLGGSLPLLLLASNIDFQKFINLNQVVAEISAALIGSSAIVICVPITAFVASELVKNLPKKTDLNKLES